MGHEITIQCEYVGHYRREASFCTLYHLHDMALLLVGGVFPRLPGIGTILDSGLDRYGEGLGATTNEGAYGSIIYDKPKSRTMP